jgi:hypothetical protein
MEKMTNNTEVTNLPLADIKVDQACQARVTTDATTIAHYAEIMTEEGCVFPPVVVYYDGTDHWLSDGFHRHAAAEKAALDSLKAEIREGTRRDAILYAVGANATLRRTREDKRHAVGILVADEEWSKWSNRTIAHRCGVDEKLVRTLRCASAAKPQIARKVERNGKTYDMNIDNIGRKDGLEELLSAQPDVDEHPPQAWFVGPEPPTTGRINPEDEGGERKALSDRATRSDEVQLEELMSAWARASAKVQQQFLATIGVSPHQQVEADPGLAEAASSMEPEPSPAANLCAMELPHSHRLFEMWKIFKRITRADGLKWVADNCPSVYHDSHFKVTESLVPFRQAARGATPKEVAEFLELARVYQAENQYS